MPSALESISLAPKMATQAKQLAFGVHWCAFQPLKLGHLTNYFLFIAIATLIHVTLL